MIGMAFAEATAFVAAVVDLSRFETLIGEEAKISAAVQTDDNADNC